MPRETLTPEQIVDAAIELLDEDGLTGLNMRALGNRLGSAATAVYWHVGSKENLIKLAGDRVWMEISLPDPTKVGWRSAATRMATELYAMLTRHVWLVQAFGSYLLYSPAKARHDDHTLAIYEAAGFRGAQAAQATATVFTFVLGNALGEAASASLSRKLARGGADADEVMRQHVAKASELATQFPRLSAAVGTPASEYGAAPAATFEFGLRAILDGLEAQLRHGTVAEANADAAPSRRAATPGPRAQ